MRSVSIIASLVWTMLVANSGLGDLWVGGHGDIGVKLDDSGQLDLHFHFEDPAEAFGGGSIAAGEYAPDAVQVFAPSSPYTQPAGSEWNFLGAGTGNPLWFLPNSSAEANNLGAPFVGFATEDLDPSGWTNGITWSLTSFAGPGNFAVWRTTGFVPTPFMSTVDGLSAADAFTLPIGAHDHFNLTFTEMGRYDVGFTASGVFNGNMLTDTANFTFIAGVPEPSSMALMAVVGIGGWWRYRRQRTGCGTEERPA